MQDSSNTNPSPKLIELEVLDALNRLPDSALLTTDESAALLRFSPSTMERMRRNATGPAYVQGGGKEARGTNQKCRYFKSDLIQWLKAHRVESSMDAAVRRGQAFVPFTDLAPKRSHFDLATRRPFYADKNGLIAGSVSDTEIDVFIRRLGSWAVVWLNPISAASQMWSDVRGHRQFALEVEHALHTALQKVMAARMR